MGKKTRPKITRITETLCIYTEYSVSVEKLLRENGIDCKVVSVNRLEEVEEPQDLEELEILKKGNQALRERMESHRNRMKLPNIEH